MTACIPRYLTGAAAAMLLATLAWSQDQGTRNESPAAEEEPTRTDAAAEQPVAGDEAANGDETKAEGEGTETAAEAPAVVVDAEEESVLDDQTFEGDDEDFIPTEEIPVDEPIPFPTDI